MPVLTLQQRAEPSIKDGYISWHGLNVKSGIHLNVPYKYRDLTLAIRKLPPYEHRFTDSNS
jgi:hypothetical protein